MVNDTLAKLKCFKTHKKMKNQRLGEKSCKMYIKDRIQTALSQLNNNGIKHLSDGQIFEQMLSQRKQMWLRSA